MLTPVASSFSPSRRHAHGLKSSHEDAASSCEGQIIIGGSNFYARQLKKNDSDVDGRRSLSLARGARARITVRARFYEMHISHWLAVRVRPMAYQLTAAARLLTAELPGRWTGCSLSRP